ncbi:hypothetical protein N9W20_00370 [Candidatus Pelagibacter bacterium]|nr:hypothetical protein [Candidatus Pelagibacter bacterium]
MTVSSTTTKNSYSGDGSTTTFAYAFKIFADADLTVILRSAAGTETVQTLTTNYTVTNAGNASGGNVVFVTAPASGVTVVIRRNMAQTQSTDYTANDPFPAESHEDALDRLTFIAQQQQEEVDRSIKLSRTNTMTSTEFTVGASDRANKILAFDTSGEISVTQELGTYQGTDATVTTEAYAVRDIIKSTTAAQLNNVYICVATSVVGDLLTDTDHFELLVDAVSAATSATNAASSASAAASSESNAATSESNASTSESNASTSATLAENYAIKTDGAVESSNYSSKAWAIGGVDINDTNGAGSAKDWATDTTNTVDGQDYSAKEFAIGTQSGQTDGSAKQWAIGGGAGFDRDTAVSGSEYSAKYWANQAANSAQGQRDIYYGGFTSDAAAETYQTGTNLGTVDAGDLYFNTTTSKVKYYDGSAWNNIEAVDTSSFAGQGFAVAMAIAL